MRRIYFLVPDLPTARSLVEALRGADVAEKCIHLIAGKNTELEDLPEASLLQKSDFVPATARGVALGGATGLLCGLVGIALPGVVVGGGLLLILSAAGAGVGAWAGGMIALDVGHPKVREFEKQIEAGKVLMLVDVPRDREEDIKQLVKRRHPKAEIEHTDAKAPLLP